MSQRKEAVKKMATVENTSPKAKKISINEKLFKLPESGKETFLVGVKCKNCGEVFFPIRSRCINCFGEDMEEVALSKKGKIYTYTIVHNATPGYTGPVPYAVGAIELPEGIVILSPLTQSDFSKLKVGMNVELVFEKLFTNEDGQDVISFKFKPC